MLLKSEEIIIFTLKNKMKRIFMVTKYHQLSSSLKVQKACMWNYPSENLPTHRTILSNVKKFQKTCSIHNLPHVVTKVNLRVELAKNHLTDLIEEFPKWSIKKASSAVRLSFGCARRFLKEDLHRLNHKNYMNIMYLTQLIMWKGSNMYFGLVTLAPTRGPNHDDRVWWGLV